MCQQPFTWQLQMQWRSCSTKHSPSNASMPCLMLSTFGIASAVYVGPPLNSYLCTSALPAPDEAFPDLSTAATIKDSRKEKKKKQTMSLADFQAGPKASYKPPSASSRARTAKTDDDIVLPTAPKSGAALGVSLQEASWHHQHAALCLNLGELITLQNECRADSGWCTCSALTSDRRMQLRQVSQQLLTAWRVQV